MTVNRSLSLRRSGAPDCNHASGDKVSMEKCRVSPRSCRGASRFVPVQIEFAAARLLAKMRARRRWLSNPPAGFRQLRTSEEVLTLDRLTSAELRAVIHRG